jgi:5-methylcytosine-specific restriction enzyme subunit McrC
MTEAVVFQDLSPRPPADSAEDQWLARLAAHLENDDHVLRLSGGGRIDEEDDPALRRGPDGNWWAGRFIGELRFEDRELRIEPRLGVDVIGAWLAHVLNLTVVPKAATSAVQGPLIVQLVDRVWSAAVADAARHGGPRLRRTSHHDHRFVRGRLDIGATVRHRAERRPLVGTIRTERDLENPVSRVLVLADRALRSLLAITPTWRPALTGEVLSQLRGAVGSNPKLPDIRELHRVRYSPITRRFAAVALLSHEIARRRGHLTSATRADVSGVLIDVAELWELFLVHSHGGLLGLRASSTGRRSARERISSSLCTSRMCTSEGSNPTSWFATRAVRCARLLTRSTSACGRGKAVPAESTGAISTS